MNIHQITKAGLKVLSLIDTYSTNSKKQCEMIQDPLLFGFFEAHFGKMTRQKIIYIGRTSHPKRVDFRYGGRNPVLIEFAIRPPHGWSELHGPSNRGELNKLTRFSPKKAKLRVLLLFDLASLYRKVPIEKEILKASYNKVKPSRGNYRKHPVRVIYFHKDTHYNFKWSP
jgi:hypothetical protein